MKKFTAEEKRIVSGKAKKNHYAKATFAPEEDLRKLLRRAVKAAPVPADLESKVWNLIGMQL